MRLRQVVVVAISILLLLSIYSFQYTVEVNKDNGKRNVSYGVPNIFTTSYNDEAINGPVSNPYEGIPTEKDIASYKTKAMVIVAVIGALLTFFLV